MKPDRRPPGSLLETRRMWGFPKIGDPFFGDNKDYGIWVLHWGPPILV